MRTSRKLILTRLLSLVMVFTMVIPMLTVGAAAEDLHDHTEYDLDCLTSDWDLDSWTAEKDAQVQAIESSHDHASETGCMYDAEGNRVCTADEALCALGGDHDECIYDADGNMVCCEILGVEMDNEPSLWEKVKTSVASFFDMSNITVNATAAGCSVTGLQCSCNPGTGVCTNSTVACTVYSGTQQGPHCFMNSYAGGGSNTGGGDTGGGDTGGGDYSGGYTPTTPTTPTTTTNITNNYYTKCPFCGSSSTHNSQCPTLASWYANECAYCRSTAHKMKDCPEYKKTLPQNVKTCNSCGVVYSATINGVAWEFPHEVSCDTLKDFWTNITSDMSDDGDVTIENKGSQGIYINGQLIAGTNFNASLIGTGGGGVKVADDQGYSTRVSATKSANEATVLTYPRTEAQLKACASTGDPEHDFYDDPSWKDIIRGGVKSYSSTDSGIWDYGGSKYRIAKVPQAKDERQYVLVRIPSDWISRLAETNPKAQGKVPTPTGYTTTETVTGTTTVTDTSTSTSQPKPQDGSNSYNFGSVTQGAKPSTGYDSTAAGASKAGAKVGSDGKPTGNNSYKGSDGTTYSFVTNKDGTVAKDADGNLKIKSSSETTSTHEEEYSYTVEVHHCEYAYYYTDICKTGSVTFSGSYSYNQGNSQTYTSSYDPWGTGAVGGSTSLGSTWNYSSTKNSGYGTGVSTSAGSVYKPGSYYKDPVYTTQPVVPGYSTYSASSPYSTSSAYSSKYSYDLSSYYTSQNLAQPTYNYSTSYNDYTSYKSSSSYTTSNTVSGNGNSVHVKTQFSCCSSNTGSTTEPHNHGAYTYTDMGTDLHRVEDICADCGHITVSYESHTAGGESCTKCGRALGRYVQWHWYNSAEGPVITTIWTPFYSIMKFPETRGRQDYTFTGWYTDWGGVGQHLDPDKEYLYVHIMPADFYAAWAFIIQHDFEAPSIMIQYYESEEEAKKTRGGQAITDLEKPVDEMWVKITSLDFEGHSVEAHKQFVGQASTIDNKNSDHYKWHKDNPLWTSGLIEGVENWVGSLQLAGEGPDTWHESPYIVKVTRNEPISVIARDAWGNTRTHIIKVTNFDEGAPVIEGFTQSNDSWTNSPVRVFVSAHDDQALATQAYKWDYVLSNDTTNTVHPGTWTATPYFDMPDAGYVRVTVKDSVGKETESAPIGSISQWYAVSNIDKIPLSLSGASGSTPTLGVSYEVSTTEKVSAITGVTITLNIVDPQDSTFKKSSGLAPTPISWEGLGVRTDWTTRKSVTVHQNGDIVVKLRDAVGNVSVFPIHIGNIVTSGPAVSLTGRDVDGRDVTPSAWVKGPVTLFASATFGEAGPRGDGLSFSWDGGISWTSQNTFVATTNGTYRCIVRDNSGTTAETTIYLGRVDSTEPVVGVYLYKGVPDDWNRRFSDGRGCTERDYVWKLRIDVEDPGAGLPENNPSVGSGLYSIQYHWIPGINGEGRIVNLSTGVTAEDRAALGGTITPTYYTDEYGNQGTTMFRYKHEFDCPNPGTYQITVIDRSGNVIRVEKIAQWTDLGESTSGPNPNVPITLPDTGGGPGGNDDSQRGTAGQPYDANIEDLVFGEDTVYDTRQPSPWSQNPMPYPTDPGKGIPVNFQAQITRNRWGTGYVTYNGIKYPVTFTNPDSEGLTTDISDFEGKPNAKVLGTGNKISCHAFIPITAFTQDVRNARIYVTINEWDNEACTNLVKTGSENLFTSVQKSKPTITYTYNRVTDTMTVVATSAMSGIRRITYTYDPTPGVENDYTGPFVIGDPKPERIILKATDNLGYETTLVINTADLGLNGSSGGVGSLPQNDQGLSGDTSSYHSSNRAADIYIIGGTRGNTDQHPAADVFNKLLGNG